MFNIKYEIKSGLTPFFAFENRPSECFQTACLNELDGRLLVRLSMHGKRQKRNIHHISFGVGPIHGYFDAVAQIRRGIFAHGRAHELLHFAVLRIRRHGDDFIAVDNGVAAFLVPMAHFLHGGLNFHALAYGLLLALVFRPQTNPRIE